MSVRFMVTLPVGCILDVQDKADLVTTNIKDAMLMQNNFKFHSDSVTGTDGEIYTWLDDNHRTGFADDHGSVSGNPSAIAVHDNVTYNNKFFTLYDVVGKRGAYICQLGFGTDVNHRWLSNVVGFDMMIKTIGVTTVGASNTPSIGKIGMTYIHPLTGVEFIYKPTLSIKGGEIESISQRSDFKRYARKIQENSGPWKDIHEQDLRFTGFIWEWKHGSGGGMTPTTEYCRFGSFKPIISMDVNDHIYPRVDTAVKFHEMIPRMRGYNEINTIDYDTFAQ